MQVIKVTINQEPVVVAGDERLDVLSTIISCTGKLGSQTNAGAKTGMADITLVLSGATLATPAAGADHVRWISERHLHIGDVIKIDTGESLTADKFHRDNRESSPEFDERRMFENCRHTYFSLKDKYEPE